VFQRDFTQWRDCFSCFRCSIGFTVDYETIETSRDIAAKQGTAKSLADAARRGALQGDW
jgi:hypothetical protein